MQERRNVEIKAQVGDWNGLKSIAETVSDTECRVLEQEDFFFPARSGMLKLRILEKGRGELIRYSRKGVGGPALSTYQIFRTENPLLLKEVLASSLGVSVVVKKRRLLYLAGQTRIHLDRVENLGDFVELECVLTDDQSEEEGRRIVSELMNRLGIGRSALIFSTYADMIRSAGEAAE
jgi:predicted adenylyl cyclase CyaB